MVLWMNYYLMSLKKYFKITFYKYHLKNIVMLSKNGVRYTMNHPNEKMHDEWSKYVYKQIFTKDGYLNEN